MPGLAPAGDLLSCSRKKVGKEALPASPALRAEGSPEAHPFARRKANKLALRNPALTPRCGRPAGPVAKLAGQKPAVVGQRDRTSPGEPPSLGGSEGNEKLVAGSPRRKRNVSDPLSLPVQNIAADNAVLFLWTTHAFLESAFDVMRAWGFKYQRCLTWDKANGVCFFGFHHRTELCLFGYRGKIEMYPRRKAIPTVFRGRSERHSAKPDEFYRLVEPLGERRIDVFARRPRDGWTVWGNEV